MSGQISRRTLISGIGGAALLSAGALPALAACGNGSTSGSGATNAKITYPTYVPYPGVKPDLPATEQGVAAGYLAYPANPVTATTEPPGKGGKVTAMTLTYNAVPPPMGQNRYWQELNKRLGLELNLNVVPNADYLNKLTAIVAGGDLPDMMFFYGAVKPPQFPALLRAKFQDLSEYLSGDSVKEYPFLANIPTQCWRNTAFAGGLYGMPIPRPLVGAAMLVREDLIRERGLQRQPTNFAEFRELCKGLTDARNNRWAMGAPIPTGGGGTMAFLEQMNGAPNIWREEGGKFTHHYETEAAKQAVSDMLTLFKDGVFHPDSIGSDTVQVKTWLKAGTIAMNRDGFVAWSADFKDLAEPEKTVGAILAPGRDGGKGVDWSGGGSAGVVAFRKADKAKITELLRVCNWLAAPFGTTEYQFRKYGLPGVHYELNGSEPVPTDAGKTEVTVPVQYLTDSPYVLYQAGKPALTKVQHEYLRAASALAVADPSIGLFSETQNSKGGQLDKQYTDLLQDIFAGRKPFSAWDEGVQQWRRNGGDQIRKEYEEAFQQAHS